MSSRLCSVSRRFKRGAICLALQIVRQQPDPAGGHSKKEMDPLTLEQASCS